MKKIKLLVTSVIISIVFLASTVTFAEEINKPTVTRLSGQDRYQTCNQVVDKGWSQSDYAILVNSNMFADAITSAPLAKKYNAPILLTEGNKLTDSTKDELQKLGVKNVYIIGGTGVVSSNIENTLKTLGITTKRIYGKDRFETSISVAKELGEIKGVFAVSGETWEDALSVAPIAAQLQYPIILVSKSAVPSTVQNYIDNNKDKDICMIGGWDALESNISSKLNATKVYDQIDKYGRNLALINDYQEKLDLSKIFIASDKTFADALSGSALAAKDGNPIILLGDTNQDTTLSFINSNGVKAVNVLGGTGVLSDNIVNNVIGNGSSSISLDSIPDYTDLTSAQSNSLLSQLEGDWYNEIHLKDKNVNVPYDGKVLRINKNYNYQLVIGSKNDAKGEILQKIKKVSKDQYLFSAKDGEFSYDTLFTIDTSKNSITLVYETSKINNGVPSKNSYNETFIRTDLAKAVNKAAYIGKFKDSNNKVYEFQDGLTAAWPNKNFKYSLAQLDESGNSYLFVEYDSSGKVANRYISEDQNDKRVFYSAVENAEKWTDADASYKKDKQLFVLTKIN